MTNSSKWSTTPKTTTTKTTTNAPSLAIKRIPQYLATPNTSNKTARTSMKSTGMSTYIISAIPLVLTLNGVGRNSLSSSSTMCFTSHSAQCVSFSSTLLTKWFCTEISGSLRLATIHWFNSRFGHSTHLWQSLISRMHSFTKAVSSLKSTPCGCCFCFECSQYLASTPCSIHWRFNYISKLRSRNKRKLKISIYSNGSNKSKTCNCLRSTVHRSAVKSNSHCSTCSSSGKSTAKHYKI